MMNWLEEIHLFLSFNFLNGAINIDEILSGRKTEE